MNNKKLYVENDDDLEVLLRAVKIFYIDGGMQFGYENERKLHLRTAHC